MSRITRLLKRMQRNVSRPAANRQFMSFTRKDTTLMSSQATFRVGLDIGYGYTKLVAEDERAIVFPSVCGYAQEIKYRADEVKEKLSIEDQLNARKCNLKATR